MNLGIFEKTMASNFLTLTIFLLFASLAGSSRSFRRELVEPPTATILASDGKTRTTFVGRTLNGFNQDLFLGVRFADEPTRFTPSKLKTAYASNDSDSGVFSGSAIGTTSKSNIYYNATEYGHDCPGYGSDTTELVNMGLVRLSENCLNLNVIRPQTDNNELLPVLIWIFGGGWQQGATADPRSFRT